MTYVILFCILDDELPSSVNVFARSIVLSSSPHDPSTGPPLIALLQAMGPLINSSLAEKWDTLIPPLVAKPEKGNTFFM